MKLLILGDGGHGKDTLADMLEATTGLTAVPSSHFCAEEIVFPALRDLHGYKTAYECYTDRRNHREEWHLLIAGYNKDDPTRLARAILEAGDIYVGMRAAREVEACLKAELFDFIYWVDASPRVERESTKSMSVSLAWLIGHPDRTVPIRFMNNSGAEMIEGEIHNVRSDTVQR